MPLQPPLRPTPANRRLPHPLIRQASQKGSNVRPNPAPYASGQMQDFRTFFQIATGHGPHGYQARIARDGLPDLVAAPTGTGKTGVILAWLWRRLHGPDRSRTPRRLVYALPQRSLTDQVSGQVRSWLANLGLADEVALQVAMGARWET